MAESVVTTMFRRAFGRKRVDLTDSAVVVGGSGDTKKELGVGGEQIIRSSGVQLGKTYAKEEIRQDNLKITDYKRMADNDGQVQMLINAVFNTILGAGIEIKDDDEYEDSKEDSEEKKFIEKNLLSPVWKGGMEISMDLTNRYQLRAFIEGYRLFEVVYRNDEDGKVYLRKLAPRAGANDNEIKILVDKNNNFLGFKQRLSSSSGKMIDVSLINDGGIKKVHRAVFGAEFGSLYGRSGLRAAWYHYDKAHKGLFLNHVGHELGVIHPRLIKVIGNPPDDVQTAVLNAFDRIHVESSIKYPKDQFEVEFPVTTDAAVMTEGRESIKMHYSLMAKSILAQFVDLGSNVSSTGSRSLGESQVDFFKEGLKAIAKTLIEDPWNEIIADIIKINFGGEIYPTLQVNPIDDDKAKLVYDMLLEMTKKGDIPDVLKNRIVTMGADSLGLEVSEEELQQERDEKQAEQDALMKQEQQNIQMKNAGTLQQAKAQKLSEFVHNHVELEDSSEMVATEEPVQRPLYLDEQKVKLSDIKMKLDDSKLRAEYILRNKLNKEKERVVNSFILAIRQGRKAIGKIEVNLADSENTYNEELILLSNELYEFGKQMSANEMNKSVPTTPKSELTGIRERTNSVAEEQEARLRLRLSMVANEALDSDIAENDAKVMLEQEYDSFWDKAIVPTVGLLVSKMFNKGRQLTFDKYQEYIFAFRYTAVLDSRTTAYCRELDGKVFQATDPNYALLTPPNHFGCRSFWTEILPSEAGGVQVEGKPVNIPVYSSVSTFEDIGK